MKQNSRYLRRPGKPRPTDPAKVRAYLRMLEISNGRSINQPIDWNNRGINGVNDRPAIPLREKRFHNAEESPLASTVSPIPPSKNVELCPTLEPGQSMDKPAAEGQMPTGKWPPAR